jgi:hypothetical protein
MLSTCNNACVDTLILPQTTQCATYQRSEVPVKLILALCNVDFPAGQYDDPTLASAVEALFTAGSASATFELADFQWADPTTTTKQYLSRRNPPNMITTGRQMTAKDFNAVDVDPANAAFPYFDRDFYRDVVQNKAVKIRGYVTDSGRIYLFLDKNGNFMAYNVNYFIGWDNEVEGQSVEFKNYIITFVADPLSQIVTPYLDIPLSGNTNLGWLYQAN